MSEDELAALVADQKAGKTGVSMDRTAKALVEYLYFQLMRFRLDGLNEDTRSDYIVWLYPRLERIIRQYDCGRAKFSTYIRWVIRLSWRTFIRERYTSEARERVYEMEETARIAESGAPGCAFYASEDETVTELSNSGTFLPGATAKQREIRARTILLLACKSGQELDDSFIQRVSAETSWTEAALREKLEYIRLVYGRRNDLLRVSAEKRNMFYVRSLNCRYQMKYLDPGTARFETLEREYRYCRKRFERLNGDKARSVKTPSNRLLSKVLGISRGTIDSTLASAFQRGYADES